MIPIGKLKAVSDSLSNKYRSRKDISKLKNCLYFLTYIILNISLVALKNV